MTDIQSASSISRSHFLLGGSTQLRCQLPRPSAYCFNAILQGRSQDFLKGGAQPSLARQTISPACQMYCARITGDLSAFSLET